VVGAPPNVLRFSPEGNLGRPQTIQRAGERGGVPTTSPGPTYRGIFPCLRFGCGTRLDCSIRSALISFGRVWRGSITSSM